MARNRSFDHLRKEYFGDPSHKSKVCPMYPEFKHLLTQESLWIHGCHSSCWVGEELERREDIEKKILDSVLLCHDEVNAFVASLRSCAKNKDLYRGIRVHRDVLKKGLLEKCAVPLVSVYAKFGAHNRIARQGFLGNNLVLGTALVDMYAKCGALSKAALVLEELPVRDVVSWSALIAGYAQHGQGEQALNCFEQMKHEGLSPDAVTFACALKACGSISAAGRGEQIHDEIARQGLLGKNMVLGNALVDMYVKCSSLMKAQRVLDELPARNVISWTTLIAGYAQQGLAEQALICFEQMQREGISPNPVTYICILKACGSIQAAHKGEQIHDEISRQGLLENNVVLGNALVDMYAKCGALMKAARVLEDLPVQNVVSWNALITGYVQQGKGEQVLYCFERMQRKGLSPDGVTFLCILKACGSIGAADTGEQIHEEIARQGLLENDDVLGTAVVDMYAKCGALAKAQQVLEKLSCRDVVAWSALIAGYAEQGQGEQALQCFEQMQDDGVFPNAVTFLSILKACGSIGAADRGEQVHDEIARQGLLENDIVLGTAVVDMYAKCGALAKAQQVLEELPVRNVISWTALISGYAQKGQAEEALNCFEQMQHKGISPNAVTFLCILDACGSLGAVDKGEHIHDEIAREGLLENNIVLGNALVNMYAKCGALDKAQQVLEELSVRDVVSWSALIAGYAQLGEGEQALYCFEKMQDEGVSPNVVTFLCALKACGSTRAADKGEQIHDEIVRQGLLGNDIVLATALVDMYAKCGAVTKAQQVLEELRVQNVLSWNALIAGYAQQGQAEEALNCLRQMKHEGLSPDVVTFLCILKACGSIGAADKGEQIHDEIVRRGLLANDIVLGNALVDMYAKCGAVAKAQRVIEELPGRDVVSWNALIAGYAEQGQAEQALNCLGRMQREELSPNVVTFLCILKACGSVGLADRGEQIHNELARQGLLEKNFMLGSAVVDMYARCGFLAKAQAVLEELPIQSVVSWNALIAGYAQQGEGEQALHCFERMQNEGLSPDGVTLVCVLKACGIMGLADDALMYFVNMRTKYGIKPDLWHYTCMVDVLGRAGHLAKAAEVIQNVPSFYYSTALWSALLGACRKWGDVNVGRWAFEHAIQVDQSDAAAYVLMANIYAAAGMHKDAENIEAVRTENEVWKKPADRCCENAHSFWLGTQNMYITNTLVQG